MICCPLREIEALLMRCVPSAFPLTTTIWHGDVPSYWNVSVKVSGGPASRMYCLGPKATVISAAGTCKVRTVEVSVTEESRNSRLDNKSLLFMGTSREIRLLGFSLVFVGYPRIAHTSKPNSPAGGPRFPPDTDGQGVELHKLRSLDQWRGERFYGSAGRARSA